LGALFDPFNNDHINGFHDNLQSKLRRLYRKRRSELIANTGTGKVEVFSFGIGMQCDRCKTLLFLLRLQGDVPSNDFFALYMQGNVIW